MDAEKAKAHDLRKMSIHEAGHATAAAHFGVKSQVAVWPNPDGGVGERHVLGRTWLLQKLPSAQAATLVGLAGLVAQMVDADDSVTATEIGDAIELGYDEISDTDLALAGKWSDDDIEQCIDLVRKLWPEIEQRAAALAASLEV